MTRVDDALFAARAGIDAIGLIFYTPSPRAVSLIDALRIRDALPPLVSTVALFVNADAGVVHEVCKKLNPSLVQFHGDETHEFCAQFKRPYVKAIRVGATMRGADLLQCEAAFGVNNAGVGGAKAMLLDTLNTTQYGGTGESFDWAVIPPEMRARIILSGGLHPQNVGHAVASVRPWAVDVCSGVEALDASGALRKGFKDTQRISAFIAAVRAADQGT